MPKGKKYRSKQGQGERFEEGLKRIEEIASFLGEGKPQLHEALALYQEGMELVKDLRRTLKASKARVEKLNRLTGQLKDFDPGDSSSS